MDFNPTSAFLLFLFFSQPSEIRGELNAAVFIFDFSATGPAQPSRDSQLERESEKGTGRSVGGGSTRSNNARANQISQE